MASTVRNQIETKKNWMPTYMSIFLPKVYREALWQSSCAKLANADALVTTLSCVLASCRSFGEDQSTPLSTGLFDVVILEGRNSAECSSRTSLKTILRRDVEEWLPNVVESIKKHDTGDVFRFREFYTDSLPGERDMIIGIRGHREMV